MHSVPVLDPPKDALKDLELLIRSRYGLIVLETVDHDRAEILLRHLADLLGLPLFVWTLAKGLRRSDLPTGVYDTVKPAAALAHVNATTFGALYHFQDLGPYLKEAALAAQLRDVAQGLANRSGALVLTGALDALPETVRTISASVRLAGLTPEECRALLDHIVRDLSARQPVEVELSDADRARLVASLRGLTLFEAEKLLTRAIVEDGRLAADDLAHVIEAKRAVIEREGVLEYYPAEESMEDVADLVGLKAWLAKRRAILAEPQRAAEFGLSFPKGVLLLGVPGCGKSLCAKAVSMEWGLPLLKLDTARLYNKYIGESEKNFERAMRVAERMAPVVLWIDEIEKAFAAGGEVDGGLSQRVLGNFLSWLQDRKGDVFVVATANDVARLPPELLRKGRFDEVFFVDLPDAESRAAIFGIHLRKRRQDLKPFDLHALAAATEGFSGAEIEQAVVSALYTAFSVKSPLTPALLLAEIRRTRPLSVTMAERIAALREWARGRTVSAH